VALRGDRASSFVAARRRRRRRRERRRRRSHRAAHRECFVCRCARETDERSPEHALKASRDGAIERGLIQIKQRKKARKRAAGSRRERTSLHRRASERKERANAIYSAGL
jgi:hypothetical protein